MGKVLHTKGNAGGSGVGYLGIFTDFDALVLAYPTATTLSLAYVQNSQGTAWLPGSMLGTFYSKGTYLFDGVNWVSGLDEVSAELQSLIDNANTQDLESVLIEGNTTGSNDILVDLDQVIKNTVIGGVEINLNATIFNDDGLPRVSFNGATNTPINLVGFAYTTPFDITSTYIVGDQLQVIDTQGNVNDGVHTITAISFNGASTEIQWAGMVSDINSPYGDWAKQGDGTEFVIGTQNSRINDYADRFGITSDRERLNFSITGRGSIVSSTDDISIEAIDSNRVGLIMFDTVGFSRLGELKMYDNLLSDRTTINFGGSYPTSVSSSGTTFKQNVKDSTSIGGKLIIVKTDESAYSNRFILNKLNEAFETVLNHTTPTADRVQSLQDKDGVVALTSDILKTKSGLTLNVSFSGNPKIATVNFATAFSDVNYSPIITCETINGTSFTPVIESILAGSFIINMDANNINDLTSVRWTATKHGEN